MVTPSPRPISTRQRMSGVIPLAAAKGVSNVNRLHSPTPVRSTTRPPYRLAARPPTIWVSVSARAASRESNYGAAWAREDIAHSRKKSYRELAPQPQRPTRTALASTRSRRSCWFDRHLLHAIQCLHPFDESEESLAEWCGNGSTAARTADKATEATADHNPMAWR